MEIIDITMAIEAGMPLYKNRASKAPVLSIDKSFENDGFMESSIKMNMHTGTHVDAPLHFNKGGDDIAALPPENFVGSCRVLDFTYVEGAVSENDIAGKDLDGVDFLLLKTRNSIERRSVEFVYLDASAAGILAGKQLKGVGIDGLGIERNQEGHPTHKRIFNAGMIVVEGLDLKDVPEGEYLLVVLPLKIVGAEAAPARALLLKDFTHCKQMVYNEEK